MSYLRFSPGIVGIAALAAVPCLGSADTFVIRRDNVIPVSFEDGLTLRDNRPGDTFAVHVLDSNQLPVGTELMGRVDRIHPARGRRPASMDLHFFEVLLPDRSRVPLDAAPIPLDDKYITHYGDGRMVAKQDVRAQQNDVLGGAIGGFIVGSILHRRVAATIIGTMVGISAAESERAKDSNVIATPGQKVGALINHDVTIDYNGPQQSDINRTVEQNSPPARTYGTHTAANIQLRYDHAAITFPDDALPYRIGQALMVPLDATARQLGLDVDRRADRTIYVDGPDNNIRLTMDSREARLNGRRFDLPRTVLEFNGVVYVPLDALAPLLKHDLFVNEKRFESG